MQVYWGNIHESDISTFAGTLILPSYMSHLQLVPFRFAGQTADRNSDQSLLLTYTTQGRVEEFELCADIHALDLLCYTCAKLKREQIAPPSSGAIWSWPTTSSEEESDKNRSMRVFFEPKEQILGFTSPFPFLPEKAYLSVSKNDLFLHRDVIIAYFCSKISSLGVPLSQESVCFSLTSLGIRCSSPMICWEWSPELDVIFNDILIFANLKHWFAALNDVASPNLTSFQTDISENGIHIHPCMKIS